MSQHNPTALIVDDAILDNKILTTQLRRIGFYPVTLFSEKEVRDHISKTKYDAFFVDLNISSELSGFDVISQIRGVNGTEPKIIVVSGMSDPKTVSEALSLGADDYLCKPFNLSLLASKLSCHFQNYKLDAYCSPLTRVPVEVSKVTVEMTYHAVSVTEHGVTLKGNGLLNKGSVFHLTGECIAGITGNATPVPVTVVSTWQRAPGPGDDQHQYFAFAAFDSNDVELLSTVRRWLAAQQH